MSRPVSPSLALVEGSAVGTVSRDPGVAPTINTLWARIRQEAEQSMASEPLLTTFLISAILIRASVTEAIIGRIAARLEDNAMAAGQIARVFTQAFEADPTITEDFVADLVAVLDRDPACTRFIEPILYFKGFQAIQAHRLAHWLWRNGRRDLALHIQSRSSSVLQCDIHPAARIGKGIFLDHATGLVIGATAVVEDNVSILQDVTLGGTGKESGDRHPKVRRGVMIGAGAKILGNIEIGSCARIAAGSVVLNSIPSNTTAAGVPARIVGNAGCAEPSRTMDQILNSLAYESFTYAI
ncbi:MAG: serine O-acetyltransferase [Hyphomicrobiales bacterium]|jgi:serine O-acetyltransferase|nr:serine O-acetyltransferase [Hyphomicrobiales bacterium]